VNKSRGIDGSFCMPREEPSYDVSRFACHEVLCPNIGVFILIFLIFLRGVQWRCYFCAKMLSLEVLV